jgi:hypothetical protein
LAAITGLGLLSVLAVQPAVAADPVTGQKSAVVEAPPLTVAERALALGQEAVKPVVDRLHELDPNSTTAGLSGVEVDALARTVDVYWAGPVPASVTALATTAGVTVRVHRSRYSQASMDAAADSLMTRWQQGHAAGVDGLALSSIVQPATGEGLKLGISFADHTRKTTPSKLTATLTQSLSTMSSAVAISSIEPTSDFTPSTGRQDDFAKWYGGSRYINKRDPNDNRTWSYCSTGYTVITASGAQRMMTASHCFASGIGNLFTPTGTLFATSDNVARSLPSAQLDSAMVETAGAGLLGRVYVGPYDSATSRAVSGYEWVSVNDSVCGSGATSGLRCALNVKDRVLLHYCERSECFDTRGWLAYNPQVGMAVAGGDSGGPVINYRSDGTAGIKGIIAAGQIDVTCPASGLDPAVTHRCLNKLFFVSTSDLNAYWHTTVLSG